MGEGDKLFTTGISRSEFGGARWRKERMLR